MEDILLVEVGKVDRSVIGFVAACLRDNLAVRPAMRHKPIDVRSALDPRRGQYSSTEILAALLRLGSDAGERVLGIADVDLFIPIFTFVFGEAQLGGRAALMSLTRLRQEFYGLPPSEDLLYLRAEKEAMHELGHTFGLVHCRSYDCAMHFSNSVEEVDLKSNTFCESCEAFRRAKSRHPSSRRGENP
jgi:archaemetzincin